MKDFFLGLLEFLKDNCSLARQFIRDTWPLLTALILVCAAAVYFAKPAPPKHIRIATGAPGTSSHIYADNYVEYFKKHGITLEPVMTEGTQDSVERMLDKKNGIQAAFVQGGVMEKNETKDLLSLGSLAYEPLWFFHHGNINGDLITAVLEKKTLAIGPEKSGTNVLVRHIMDMDQDQITGEPNLLEVEHEAARDMLLEGKIDGMILVDSLDSPIVKEMLSNNSIQVVNFKRASAYEKQFPYLHAVELPAGSIDLKNNLPAENIQLLAPTANLAVDKDLHAAIQMLFLEAATEAHHHRSFFVKAGEFPSYKDTDIKQSRIARRFYQNGPPVLMHYLPFWLAEFIDRMAVVLMPMFIFLYSIIKSFPNFRERRILKHIQQQYGALKFLESEIVNYYDPKLYIKYVSRFDKLERNALSLKVPEDFAQNYFQLRSSIDFVKKILNQKSESEIPTEPLIIQQGFPQA